MQINLPLKCHDLPCFDDRWILYYNYHAIEQNPEWKHCTFHHFWNFFLYNIVSICGNEKKGKIQRKRINEWNNCWKYVFVYRIIATLAVIDTGISFNFFNCALLLPNYGIYKLFQIETNHAGLKLFSCQNLISQFTFLTFRQWIECEILSVKTEYSWFNLFVGV